MSILGSEKDILDNTETMIRREFERIYITDECKYTINGRIINVRGNLKTNSSFKGKTVKSDLFEIDNVFGNYSIMPSNGAIESLEGSPRYVQGDFVAGYLKITSINCSTKTVGQLFTVAGCANLTNLKGSPESVGSYECSYTYIESLEGISQQIDTDVYCRGCRKLKSFEFLPEVGGNIFTGGTKAKYSTYKYYNKAKSSTYFNNNNKYVFIGR